MPQTKNIEEFKEENIEETSSISTDQLLMEESDEEM